MKKLGMKLLRTAYNGSCIAVVQTVPNPTQDSQEQPGNAMPILGQTFFEVVCFHKGQCQVGEENR
jgi:hypothetical protein